jgi:triacylglycerol esterase/lipase EstA (alpha/beta hydrolase family)
VLAHGLGGDKPFLKCFMGIPEDLKPLGVPVYTPKVARYGTVFARAETLKEQIMQVLEETRAPKVNIIGHSMGGLDARYLAWVPRLWLPTTIAHTTHNAHTTRHTRYTQALHLQPWRPRSDGVVDHAGHAASRIVLQ